MKKINHLRFHYPSIQCYWFVSFLLVSTSHFSIHIHFICCIFLWHCHNSRYCPIFVSYAVSWSRWKQNICSFTLPSLLTSFKYCFHAVTKDKTPASSKTETKETIVFLECSTQHNDLADGINNTCRTAAHMASGINSWLKWTQFLQNLTNQEKKTLGDIKPMGKIDWIWCRLEWEKKPI